MTVWRPAWRVAAWAFAISVALVAFLAGYVAVAFALPHWPQSPRASAVAAATTDAPVEAYVVSNGAHTDLVLPLRSARIDWSTVFPAPAFAPMPADAEFVAIGWGDREFYLNTPRWRDLTAARALGALSGTGRTLLHVTWLRRGELGALAWRLPLQAAQYDALVAHVEASLGAPGMARLVPGATYSGRDAFFEARGAYDVFTTCNTWTGDALRRAGVPVSRWTPFAENVVVHLVPLARPAAPPGG